MHRAYNSRCGYRHIQCGIGKCVTDNILPRRRKREAANLRLFRIRVISLLCQRNKLGILHPVGADCRHRNFPRHQLNAKCTAVPVQKSLGRRIDIQTGERLKRRGRTDLQNSCLLLHIRKADLRHIHRCPAVQINHPIQRFERHILGCADLSKACCIDQETYTWLFVLQKLLQCQNGLLLREIIGQHPDRESGFLFQLPQPVFSSCYNPQLFRLFTKERLFSGRILIQLTDKLSPKSAGCPGNDSNFLSPAHDAYLLFPVLFCFAASLVR